MATKIESALSVGASMVSSPAVRAAVEALEGAITSANAAITDVRGPNPGASESYADLMARAGVTRGRGLLYPYVGSGAGNGALVELADGSVKWDMITGIGVHFMGHGHPKVVRAQIEAAVTSPTKHGNLAAGFDGYQFAETLLKYAQRGSNLKHAFITTSGAMANESAIKVCYQKHAPASRVIAFEHCFMGRSVTMCQIGDSAGGRDGVPLSTQVDYMPFWDEAVADRIGKTRFIDMSLDHLHMYFTRYPKQHACFIFELVQGEGGFNVAPKEFHEELMKACKAAGVAVWDDEIQSFGRTGSMFAYDHYGLGQFVDVFCVGKMTQACATLFTEEYNPRAGLLSGTFTGVTSDFTVGQVVLEALGEGGLCDSKPGAGDGLISRHHEEFCRHARALMVRRPEWFPENPKVKTNPGGIGGMMRFTPFGGDKAKITKACHTCFDAGVILFSCGHGPFHLRMLPPLGAMRLEDWPRVFERMEIGLAKAAE